MLITCSVPAAAAVGLSVLHIQHTVLHKLLCINSQCGEAHLFDSAQCVASVGINHHWFDVQIDMVGAKHQ